MLILQISNKKKSILHFSITSDEVLNGNKVSGIQGRTHLDNYSKKDNTSTIDPNDIYFSAIHLKKTPHRNSHIEKLSCTMRRP